MLIGRFVVLGLAATAALALPCAHAQVEITAQTPIIRKVVVGEKGAVKQTFHLRFRNPPRPFTEPVASAMLRCRYGGHEFSIAGKRMGGDDATGVTFQFSNTFFLLPGVPGEHQSYYFVFVFENGAKYYWPDGTPNDNFLQPIPIEVVRKGYPAPKPVGPTNQSLLVGRWKGKEQELEFLSNGSVLAQRVDGVGLGGLLGRYSLLSGGRLILSFGRDAALFNQLQVSKGSYLTLTSEQTRRSDRLFRVP